MDLKCSCSSNKKDKDIPMAQNLQKKPSKGILKSSRSVDAESGGGGGPTTSKRASKEQRFDEMNIMETFHPANKDYGHMKVDEPPTPYAEAEDVDLQPGDEIDANILAAKLAASMNRPPKCMESPDSDTERETEEERRKRIEFEKKRKLHYNEFHALKLAKQLMEEENDEDESTSRNNK